MRFWVFAFSLPALLSMLPTLCMAAEDLEESLAGRPPYRRLFLDASVVEESGGLKRVFHAAEKFAGNPVLRGDRPWEGWGPYVYGTVLRDDGKLKMWYQAIGQKGKDFRSCACYAESADGITWTKPNLGIVAYAGSTANNIIAADICGLPAVIRVREPRSSESRWAVYAWGGGELGPHVAFSSDAIHFRWKEKPQYLKLFSSSDVVNFFYDPIRKRYAATYKTANRRHRAVGIALSEDGISWRKPVEGPVFGADDLDPDATQIYGMPVFPYQGLYIGLAWIYHSRYLKYGPYSPERMYEAELGSPCTVDVQMAWSWDLINWTRPPERKPFIALGEPGRFDCGQIYTARAPVIMGDRLYFYYSGFNKLHNEYKDVVGAIGLATLRLDGFCSMRADEAEGWLISRREVFRTPKVLINARTRPGGYVVAELLNRNNQVIPGFSRKECIPFSGDSVRHELTWKTRTFPAELREVDKKIRFYIKRGDLYSYLPADINTELDKGEPDR